MQTKKPPIRRQRRRSDELRDVLEAVAGQIPPVKSTAGYRVATVFVAVGMLLLPLLYAVIVQAFAYGVYWHATSNFERLRNWGVIGLLLYVVLLALGVIITFFLVKPILAPQKSETPERLNPDAEPFLYDYVDAVAQAVHAKPPSSIRVGCDVNAAAGYRGGMWSMFSNDTMLLIGLPLAGKMSLREFTGVLAHELGHVAQRGGGRATYLIRRIHFWFARVVYEKDMWDVRLFFGAVSRNLALSWFCRVTMFFVWLARWIPRLLMMLGYLLSCNLLRKMEFDADRYAARLVGFKSFKSMISSLPELELCSYWAFDDLVNAYDEGRLVDDLPGLIVANMKYLKPKIRRKLQKEVRKEKTTLFDTHPGQKERIGSAKAERTEGIFRMRGGTDPPASVIFRNFPKLCRALTKKVYKEDYGLKLKRGTLRPVAEVLERREAQVEAAKAVHRYFQVFIPPLWPLPIDASATKVPKDPFSVRETMKEARREMLVALPEYKRVARKYEKAEERIFEVSCAMALFEVGLYPRASDFGLKKGTHAEARSSHRKARSAAEKYASIMLEFEMAGGRRLSAALQLLMLEQVYSLIDDGENLYYEVRRLVPDALYISELMTDLRDFRVFYHQMASLCSHLGSHQNNYDLIESILEKLERFYGRLQEIDGELQERIYPFDHAKADTTLREYALPHLPEFGDVTGILAATEYLFEQLTKVQQRLFANLAAAAEKVEDVFKLPRLPQPEIEDDEEVDD